MISNVHESLCVVIHIGLICFCWVQESRAESLGSRREDEVDLGDPKTEITSDKAGEKGQPHTHSAWYSSVFACTGWFREAPLEVSGWRGRALGAHPVGEGPEPCMWQAEPEFGL